MANHPLWLELNVDGETLEPRHQMASVPYAQTPAAERVDGVKSTPEINVGSQPVIDAQANGLALCPKSTLWTD